MSTSRSTGPSDLRSVSAVATRSRRIVLLVTAVLGTSAAGAVAAGTAADERTFVAVSGPVQSAMSLTLPFLGVLLVRDARDGDVRNTRTALAPALLGAVAAAVGVAVYGVALCAIVTSVTSSTAPGGRWEDVALVVIGSVAVQVVAQLTGTGFGLLIRRRTLACLLTVVLPLGLWAALSTSDGLQAARSWVTPFASAQRLLAGDMSAIAWAQWSVMVTIWAAATNVLGARRHARRPC